MNHIICKYVLHIYINESKTYICRKQRDYTHHKMKYVMASVKNMMLCIFVSFLLLHQRIPGILCDRILELKPTLYKQFYYKTQSGAASARAVLQCARQCHQAAEDCSDTFSVTDDGTCFTLALPAAPGSLTTYSK